jgi:hypothetical protein
MFMKAMVPMCDLTGAEYRAPVEGAWVISKGASGRFCCVLYVGPEWLRDNGHEAMTREEVESIIAKDHPNAWIDF